MKKLLSMALAALLLLSLAVFASAKTLFNDTMYVYTENLGTLNVRRDPIVKNGNVIGMKCIQMELGEPDERGRRRPVPIPDSEFTIDVDTVVMAIGTSPNPLIKSTTQGLEVNRRGGIVVEESTGATSREGVYAGGDAVTGAATVISAMGAGKVAAKAIDEYLQGK